MSDTDTSDVHLDQLVHAALMHSDIRLTFVCLCMSPEYVCAQGMPGNDCALCACAGCTRLRSVFCSTGLMHGKYCAHCEECCKYDALECFLTRLPEWKAYRFGMALPALLNSYLLDGS